MDLVKRLRFETGAPIIECRKALAEVENDVEAAKDWLREHGAAKVQSKGRLASDGLVGLVVADDMKQAGFVQVASETDFTARSAEFVNLVAHTAKATMSYSERNTDIQVENILQASAERDGPTVKSVLDEAVVAIRENLSVSKSIQLSTEDPNNFLVGYVHNRVENDLGVIAGTAGAIVELERVNDLLPEVNIQAIGKKLAMHVVAVSPLYLNVDDIPEADVEKETDFITEQVRNTIPSKKEHLLPKIVKGKITKYFKEVCLTEQQHAIEETITQIGPGLRDIGVEIKRFERLSVV